MNPYTTKTGVQVVAQQFDIPAEGLPNGWPVSTFDAKNVQSGDYIVCANPDAPSPNYFVVPGAVFESMFEAPVNSTQTLDITTNAQGGTVSLNGGEPQPVVEQPANPTPPPSSPEQSDNSSPQSVTTGSENLSAGSQSAEPAPAEQPAQQ